MVVEMDVLQRYVGQIVHFSRHAAAHKHMSSANLDQVAY